jgi:hypothetical protein
MCKMVQLLTPRQSAPTLICLQETPDESLRTRKLRLELHRWGSTREKRGASHWRRRDAPAERIVDSAINRHSARTTAATNMQHLSVATAVENVHTARIPSSPLYLQNYHNHLPPTHGVGQVRGTRQSCLRFPLNTTTIMAVIIITIIMQTG